MRYADIPKNVLLLASRCPSYIVSFHYTLSIKNIITMIIIMLLIFY